MIHHNLDQVAVVNNSLHSLTEEHRNHIAARGLDAGWAEVNCRSVDTKEAEFFLGYPAKSTGIMFIGDKYQFQFRPDVPWASTDGKKPKYRTPVGEYDAWLAKHPTDKDYWDVEKLKQSCYQIDGHPYILITEGGFKAISGCSNGLPTIALMGVTMGLTPKKADPDGRKYLVETLGKYAGAKFGFIIVFDADAKTNKNVRDAERDLTNELLTSGCPVISITGSWNVADGKGMDDYIQNNGIEAFRKILEKALKASTEQVSGSIPDAPPAAEDNFILKAEEALYADGHWVSIGETLYRFTGTHYEEAGEAKEKRRIGNWLKSYSEKVKGTWVKNRADTGSVNAVFNWVVNQTAVDASEINPDGLNCSNGVVKINPDGSHSLVSHNPSQVYTYVGGKYDPGIDPTDCDRLLECLEAGQREIFLRTAAAGLSLQLVRSKLTGRGVKGLLCCGDGSNGKDTLRTVLATVFGRGMVGKSLSDFKSYDNGRKFNLSGLVGAVCNWSSENTEYVNIDSLQSLKQYITGDPIDIERKGKDSYEYKPSAIFLANCNKPPSITGGTAAIDDRYGILSFTKTYKRNADPSKGELEADPRFKEDPDFILNRIAPAMLNKMLERMPRLLKEGIDYTSTRDAMREIQEKSNHLWEFVNEVGIEAKADGRIYIKDLWDKLQDWYQESGVLEIEYDHKGKEKLVWSDSPGNYDKPVKAVNQIYSSFGKIFPKLGKHRYNGRDDTDRRGQNYLSGIAFVQNLLVTDNIASPASPVDAVMLSASPTASPTASPRGESASPTVQQQNPIEVTGEAVGRTGEASGEASGEATTLTQRAGEAGEAISPISTEPEYSADEQWCLSTCETQEEVATTKQFLSKRRAKTTPSAPEQPKPENQPHDTGATISLEVGSKHKNIKVGDRVVVAMHPFSRYQGEKGTVVGIGGTKVTVRFDSEKVSRTPVTFDTSDPGEVVMKL